MATDFNRYVDEKNMFKNTDIKIFKLEDLIGRSLFIKRTRVEDCEIISAHDLMTKEMFVLSHNQSFQDDVQATPSRT